MHKACVIGFSLDCFPFLSFEITFKADAPNLLECLIVNVRLYTFSACQAFYFISPLHNAYNYTSYFPSQGS